MKLTKTEKAWLTAVVILYVLYNLPGFPPYGNAKAAIIHGIVTLIPLWISVYIGFFKICKIYRLKKSSDSDKREERISGNNAEEKDDELC